jgi:hypothetical protein
MFATYYICHTPDDGDTPKHVVLMFYFNMWYIIYQLCWQYSNLCY